METKEIFFDALAYPTKDRTKLLTLIILNAINLIQ
jgi:hypothetical protein